MIGEGGTVEGPLTHKQDYKTSCICCCPSYSYSLHNNNNNNNNDNNNNNKNTSNSDEVTETSFPSSSSNAHANRAAAGAAEGHNSGTLVEVAERLLRGSVEIRRRRETVEALKRGKFSCGLVLNFSKNNGGKNKRRTGNNNKQKHYPKIRTAFNTNVIAEPKRILKLLLPRSSPYAYRLSSGLANILLLVNLFQFLCLQQTTLLNNNNNNGNENYKAAQAFNVLPQLQLQQRQPIAITFEPFMPPIQTQWDSLSSPSLSSHHTSLLTGRSNINNNNVHPQRATNINNRNNHSASIITETATATTSTSTQQAVNQASNSFITAKKPTLTQARTITQIAQQLSERQQQPYNSNTNSNNNDGHHHHGIQRHAWPHSTSTSSILSLAEIEDLQDSSIRTRIGDISPATLAFDGLAGNTATNVSSGQSSQAPATAITISSAEADSFNEFDKLISRILEQVEVRQQQQQQQSQSGNQKAGSAASSKVAADPNNRTSMRFFRNNKTFASIVYTNENVQQKNFDNNNYQQKTTSNYYRTNNNQRQPRRLINCHLVDLEKHSSDVGIFENKYDIRTNDIEFKEMMQLIEQCTNIARFKPLKSPFLNHYNNQLKPNVAQLFVAKPPNKNSFVSTGSSGHKHFGLSINPGAGGGGAFRPFLVVGRPSGLTPVQFTYVPGPTLGPQQTTKLFTQPQSGPAAAAAAAPPTSQSSVSTFNQVMSGALNQELQKLPPIVDDSNKLDLPGSGGVPVSTVIDQQQQQQDSDRAQERPKRGASSNGVAIRNKRFSAGYSGAYRARSTKERQQQQEHSHHSLMKPVAQAVAKNILEKARETGKKLVLGEVTPSPSAVDSRQGGLKEALQEITSYDTTDLLAIWRGILPGTNWCGMGDRATSYNDLGFESDIDICCRAHDFCPIRLSAFSGGYGLFNWSFYTRSHCWCDQNFLDCLQRAQSPLSSVVMKFYFSIMKTTCLHDNETALAYASPPNSPFQQRDNLEENNSQQQQQPQQQQVLLLQPQSAARQRITEMPQGINFQQGQSFIVNNNNNENIQQRQQHSSIQQNNAAQQRLLLDQIRATMPIAALKQSQVVQSRIETKR